MLSSKRRGEPGQSELVGVREVARRLQGDT
jgi:hypothetical protein